MLSPTGHTYLDRPHGESSQDPEQEALRSRLGNKTYEPTPLQAFFDWDPGEGLLGVASEAMLGVEAALWGETVTDEADAEMLLLPRLPAVAQVAWCEAGSRDWDDFTRRVARHAVMWERRGLAWYRTEAVDWFST